MSRNFLTYVRRTLMVCLLLLLAFGLSPAATTTADNHGPVIAILLPVEGQRVDGPTFQVEIEVRPGSGADIDRASLVVTAGAAGDLSQQFAWEGNRATATFTESSELSLGNYTLEIRIADQAGAVSTAQRGFQFAIPEALARLIEQRMEVPWQGIITFEDAHNSLFSGQTNFIYRDPATGLAFTKQQLLNEALGRGDWLSPESPFSERVAELVVVSRRLVWRAIGGGGSATRRTEYISIVEGDWTLGATPAEQLSLIQGFLGQAYAQIDSAPPSAWLHPGSSCGSTCVWTGSGGRYDTAREEAIYYVVHSTVSIELPSEPFPFQVAEARLLFRPAAYPFIRFPNFKSTQVEVGAAVRDDWPESGQMLPLLGSFHQSWSPPADPSRPFPPAHTGSSPYTIPIAVKELMADSENLGTEIGQRQLFVQLRHTPATPGPCTTYVACTYGPDMTLGAIKPSYYAQGSIFLFYRLDFPPIYIPLVDEVYCGVGPNPRPAPEKTFDIDGDGIDDDLELIGWHNALTAQTGIPFKTDPANCDSTGNGLKDGEARKWDQASDVIRPLFTRPGEQNNRDSSTLTIKYLTNNVLTSQDVLQTPVLPQEWHWNAAPLPGVGRAFVQIDGMLHGPQALWHDRTRQEKVKVGHVHVSLYSYDLNFQSSAADNTPHDVGTFYLAVRPELAPDAPDVLGKPAYGFSGYGPLAIDTTGDFAVEIDFLSADELGGFIVSEADQPGAKMQIRDIEGGIVNFNEQDSVHRTATTLEELGVKLPFGFALKSKRGGAWEVGTPIGDLKSDGEGWEVSTSIVEMKFSPENTTGLEPTVRALSPHSLVNTPAGPVLTQQLRLLGPGGTPPGPPLIYYRKNALVFLFSGETLQTSSWNLPFPIRATNRAANPRDVLRIRLKGVVTWTSTFNERLPSTFQAPLARRYAYRDVVATNEFDQAFYIMLRRSDWHCAMCDDGRQGMGMLSAEDFIVIPGESQSGGSMATAGAVTYAAAADSLDMMNTEGPVMTFQSATIQPVTGPGAAQADTVRAAWDARSLDGSSAHPAFVLVEAVHADDDSAAPILALAGPLTVSDQASSQSLDMPSPTSGTYHVAMSLLDDGLVLHDVYTGTIDIQAAAPLTPGVQLESAVSAAGALEWSASNPTAKTITVTAIAALGDGTGNILQVAVSDPTAIDPQTGGNGVLQFDAPLAPGYYVAELALRDDTERIVGQRQIPLALGAPLSQLSGVYSDMGSGPLPYADLTVTVGVDAAAAGRYQVYADLYTADGRLIVHRQNGGANLSAGLGAVTLAFDGHAIGRAGGEGPFLLRNVELRDEIGKWLDLAPQPYTTATDYPLGSFPLPGAQVAGAFSDTGALTRADGKFGALAVDIAITVTTPSTYFVQATLVDAEGDYIDRAHGIVISSVGTDLVRILFSGREIAAADRDGPFTVTALRILDAEGTVQEISPMTYTTKAYTVGQFAGPGASLSDAYRHHIVRRPGGDVLVLDVGVTVTRTGTYQLEALLTGATGQWTPWTGVTVYLEPDTQQMEVPVNLAAAQLAAAGGELTVDVVRLLDPAGLAPRIDERHAAYVITDLPILPMPDLYLPVLESRQE